MHRIPNLRTSVATLLGVPIFNSDGVELGSVREFAVSPLNDASRVEALVLRGRDKKGNRRLLVPVSGMKLGTGGRLEVLSGVKVGALPRGADFLLLERDLLDQQIIDVDGHKVVRVNDVDLVWECVPELTLRIAEVEVGTRGAVRRLLKGLPAAWVDGVACRVRASVIPWDFVDLIDRDPARRVRLKIEQDRLAKMHPSDLADILEELAPAEREALFSSLDEEVAAEALEEVEPKTQKTLIEGMDTETVAGILDEMDPGAAADLLSELSPERSEAILGEMGDEERHDVEELLEYGSDTAAGLMTTEYVAVQDTVSVEDAVRALAEFEGDVETVTEIFILDAHGHLKAALPLSKVVLAHRSEPLDWAHGGHVVSVGLSESGKKVAELFDKYNLRALPVLDEHGQLAGVIRPEHVIGWLRDRK